MRNTLGLAVLLVLVGCGSDSGKPSPNANKDNVCDQIATIACYDMFQCCSESEIERNLGVTDPRTEDQCKDDVRKLCDRRLGPVDSSITANRAKFDSSVMNTCLNALIAPDSTCVAVDTALPWTMDCMMSAWTGEVADGGACVYKFDCSSVDSYCGASQTCTPLPTDGMPCSPQGCASSAFCNGGTCRALLGPGGMCTSNQSCMKGLFCDFSIPTPVCTALHAGGERCTGNQSCTSNQCVPGTCAGTTQSCFTDQNCNGHCSNNPSQFCNNAANCGNGTCSITTTQACFSVGNGGCPTGETCVFANQCVTGMCIGDIVCADQHLNVDYCTGPLSGLPLPPSM